MSDDTTLGNAGEVGKRLADTLYGKVEHAIEHFPDSPPEQRAAIARLVADSLYDYSEDLEAD